MELEKCNCGKPGRYQNKINGVWLMTCQKYGCDKPVRQRVSDSTTEIWSVENKVFGAYFEDKKEAEEYLSQFSPTVGMNIRSIPVISKPKTARKMFYSSKELENWSVFDIISFRWQEFWYNLTEDLRVRRERKKR